MSTKPLQTLEGGNGRSLVQKEGGLCRAQVYDVEKTGLLAKGLREGEERTADVLSVLVNNRGIAAVIGGKKPSRLKKSGEGGGRGRDMKRPRPGTNKF